MAPVLGRILGREQHREPGEEDDVRLHERPGTEVFEELAGGHTRSGDGMLDNAPE